MKKRSIATCVGMVVAALVYLSVGTDGIYNPVAAGESAILLVKDELCGEGIKGIQKFNLEDANEVYLQEVPDEIMSRFYQDGGSITYVNEIIAQDTSTKMSNAVAAYYPESNAVVLRPKLENVVKPTVVHEIGHYVDCKIGFETTGAWFSENPQFLEAASQEMNFINHITNRLYGQNSYVKRAYESTGTYEEYFASAYMMYVFWPDFLKYAAPKTYDYMQKVTSEALN